MDPQQRLLLEVAWEALEDAGIAPQTAPAAARPAVFVGADHQRLLADLRWQADTRSDLDAYIRVRERAQLRRGAAVVLPGRARAGGRRWTPRARRRWWRCTWPARACACGRATLALAGGVNLMLRPENQHRAARGGACCRRDGRCKAFDAGADGYVRGEGCGVVVLKRLADALRDGDRVLAVVRGFGGQPGRPLQRADRAQRAGAARR